MKKIKVYVASSFEIKDKAAEVISLCHTAGLQVTHDWTKESWEGLTGGDLKRAQTKNAYEDFVGARDCDWIILLNSPKGCGCWTELGIAMGAGKGAIVVQAYEPGFMHNIFTHLPGIFVVPSAMKAIKRILIEERVIHEEDDEQD